MVKGDISALKNRSTITAMKPGTLPTLFLAVTFNVLLIGSLQAEEPPLVPIAWYANDNGSFVKEGERASAILRDHKIENVRAGSASFTLSVPAEKAQEARTLLAKAIQDDGLRINLLKVESKEDQLENDKVLSGKVGEILAETAALKAGSKRIDLEKHFTTEGGLSNPNQRTYISKRCSLIKIDVRFQPLSAQQESPDDTILELSKPYLAYSILD